MCKSNNSVHSQFFELQLLVIGSPFWSFSEHRTEKWTRVDTSEESVYPGGGGGGALECNLTREVPIF